jgi:hypothetical protein
MRDCTSNKTTAASLRSLSRNRALFRGCGWINIDFLAGDTLHTPLALCFRAVTALLIPVFPVAFGEPMWIKTHGQHPL